MKVYITPQCHSKIMYFVRKAKVEISGLGRVQKAADGSMVVTSVYLLKQENGPASTDIDPEAMATLLYESRNDPGDLNFWWHSHVDMGVFWSGTDMQTIYDFGGKGYLLATVFNKKNEHRTAYYQGSNGFLPEVFVDNLDTSFAYLPTEAEHTEWENLFTTLCTEKKWEPIPGRYTGPGSTQQALGIAAGLGGDVPSHFHDPHYWAGDGYNQQPFGEKKPAGDVLDTIIGRHTGYSTREFAQAIRDLRKAAPQSVDQTDMTSRFMLWDLFEILNGFEMDDNDEEFELAYLFVQITGTPEEFSEFLDTFWDAVDEFDLIPSELPSHEKTFDAQKRQAAKDAAAKKPKAKNRKERRQQEKNQPKVKIVTP
jgi:hypothetical protein